MEIRLAPASPSGSTGPGLTTTTTLSASTPEPQARRLCVLGRTARCLSSHIEWARLHESQRARFRGGDVPCLAPATRAARVHVSLHPPARQRRLRAPGLRPRPAERSARHARVADGRDAGRHPPPSFLATGRFETIRVFDLPEVTVPSPPNSSQSSGPVELSSALR